MLENDVMSRDDLIAKLEQRNSSLQIQVEELEYQIRQQEQKIRDLDSTIDRLESDNRYLREVVENSA